MDDRKLIDLYLNRDASAADLTREKYAEFCKYIASGIVADPEDVDACLEKALEELWNSIPPRNPRDLASYLGRIVRNVSLNHWRQSPAQKRRASQVPLVLGELGACISANNDNAQPLERSALVQILNQFLGGLDPESMRIFMARYWYLRPVEQISAELNISDDHVKLSLENTRALLRQMLDGCSLKPGNILSCLEKVDRRFILVFAPSEENAPEPAPAKKKGSKKLLIPLILAAVVVVAAAVILVTALRSRNADEETGNPLKPGSSYAPSDSSSKDDAEIMDDGDSAAVGDAAISVDGALYDSQSVRLLIKAAPANSGIFLIPENMTREDSTSKLTGLTGIPEGTVEQYAAYLGRRLAAVSFRYQINGNPLEGTEEYVYGPDGVLYVFFTAEVSSEESAAISCEAGYYQDLEEATDKQVLPFEVHPEKAPEPTTEVFDSFEDDVLQESGIEIRKLTVYSDGLGCYATFEFHAEEDRQLGILLTDEDGAQLPSLPGSDGENLKSLGDGNFSITVYCQKPDKGTDICFAIYDYDKEIQYGPYSYQ